MRRILGAEETCLRGRAKFGRGQRNEWSRGSFRELEKFPAVTRDIAMIVPESTMHAEILAVIKGREGTTA